MSEYKWISEMFGELGEFLSDFIVFAINAIKTLFEMILGAGELVLDALRWLPDDIVDALGVVLTLVIALRVVELYGQIKLK